MKCYLVCGTVHMVLGDVESCRQAAELLVRAFARSRAGSMGPVVLVSEAGFRRQPGPGVETFKVAELLAQVEQEGGDHGTIR